MSLTATLTVSFVREHLRSPTVLVLLVVIPVLFVLAAAAVMGPTAEANGVEIAVPVATALGAGWSAAFLAGPLGFLQSVSSRGADRRLALAGIGPLPVAGGRMIAAALLALVVSVAACLTLWARTGLQEPLPIVLGVLAFALIYLAIGTVIGALVSDPLEGALMIVLVFLLDIFSEPAITGEQSVRVLPTRQASDVLIAAAAGRSVPARNWIELALVVALALAVALALFWRTARARS